jgi:hypothetical protein
VPVLAVRVNPLHGTRMEIRAPGRCSRPDRGIPERWGAAAGGPRYLSEVFCHFEVIP